MNPERPSRVDPNKHTHGSVSNLFQLPDYLHAVHTLNRQRPKKVCLAHCSGDITFYMVVSATTCFARGSYETLHIISKTLESHECASASSGFNMSHMSFTSTKANRSIMCHFYFSKPAKEDGAQYCVDITHITPVLMPFA